MNKTLFYQDKPLFGMDIGHRTVKVMQVNQSGNRHMVSGYGIASYDQNAVEHGVIVDFDKLASSIHQLFSTGITGEISTRRVALSVPAANTYSRILSLPSLAQKDIAEAVRLEAEQYIPVPIEDLYIDSMVMKNSPQGMDILAVAVPKKLINSYVQLCKILNLDPVVMESTTAATNRIFRYTDQHNVPTVLIDFGAVATDISIYNQHLAVTGTVPCGGDHITTTITQVLGTTNDEAEVIKIRYGLGPSKKQSEITNAIVPQLEKIIKEVRRMIRYYEERAQSSDRIQQIITFGGAAIMPGLSDYLIDHLRLPVRPCNPWDYVSFKHIKEPTPVEKPLFITAASLSVIKPVEAFA